MLILNFYSALPPIKSREEPIYKDGAKYSALTLSKDDQGHFIVMDAYGFSTARVTDDESLKSELVIQFPAQTSET